MAQRGAELARATTQRLRRIPDAAAHAIRRLSRRAEPGPPPAAGWRVVAGKEFADNLSSVRYVVLLFLLVLASIGAVATAADRIREAASQATGPPSPFLLLFTTLPEQIPSFIALIGFLGPLLGIAFGFDAVNNERAQGTLPRLVAQPIYRDDVINGKFVAGLAIIGLTLAALMAIVAGVGILRLGITPGSADVARLLLYLILACVYIGLWLGLALLCSVAMRRAATSALVAIAAWIVLTLFGALLAGLLADALAPAAEGASFAQQVDNAQLEHTLTRLSPATLYQEASAVLLNPQLRSVGIILPQQADQAIPGALPLGQSLLVVWPQVTALIAVTVVLFAIAYVAFLRQEVRA